MAQRTRRHLVVIWAVIGGHGFCWPIFPIAGSGIGVVMNAWDVYWRHPITEADIRREIERALARLRRPAGSKPVHAPPARNPVPGPAGQAGQTPFGALPRRR